jgi:hypothetical protein
MRRDGATNEAVLDGVTPEQVARVLADPRTYDGVVVGSRKIRWFDARWPEPGSRFHHTIGFGPLVIRDHSEVIEEGLPHRLVLVVNARPTGSAEVVFALAPEPGGTRVELTETPLSGPLALSWSSPMAAITRWRNAKLLQRLGDLARQRSDIAALAGRGG